MWYLDILVKSHLTLSLRLICCTTNNLRDTIPVFLKELFGFLKFNQYEYCSHSLWLHSRDCAPSPSIYESLKMPENTAYSDRIDRYKIKMHKDKIPFHRHNWKQGHQETQACKARSACHDWTIGSTTAVVMAMVRPWSVPLPFLPWKIGPNTNHTDSRISYITALHSLLGVEPKLDSEQL